ncbi:hypothetical protein HS088_TW22G00998 [Tripterygium wilfordii]|uniref:Uncharacterized protein n=1 Tax=Tripterygium wilfordii TaxID=458696 RepID=A0A7J7C055_TRIWF|nr:hypothetical protein HS088_TW22G00998 [Tripterygium wilfordii]
MLWHWTLGSSIYLQSYHSNMWKGIPVRVLGFSSSQPNHLQVPCYLPGEGTSSEYYISQSYIFKLMKIHISSYHFIVDFVYPYMDSMNCLCLPLYKTSCEWLKGNVLIPCKLNQGN